MHCSAMAIVLRHFGVSQQDFSIAVIYVCELDIYVKYPIHFPTFPNLDFSTDFNRSAQGQLKKIRPVGAELTRVDVT